MEVGKLTVLLIAGRPGAGKSEFCRWLRDNRGYVHVETDKEPDWILLALGARDGSPTPLLERLQQVGPDVAFEWGMRMEFLGAVPALVPLGVEPWWFDGEEPAAREGWLMAHGEAGLPAYEIQRDAIAAHRLQIEQVFQGRIVGTVSAGPTYLDSEVLASLVLGEATSGMNRQAD